MELKFTRLGAKSTSRKDFNKISNFKIEFYLDGFDTSLSFCMFQIVIRLCLFLFLVLEQRWIVNKSSKRGLIILLSRIGSILFYLPVCN